MAFDGKNTTAFMAVIGNNGFWPDVALSEFQRDYKLPLEYVEPTVIEQTVIAMAEVNALLVDRQLDFELTGALTLADVTAEMLNGETVFIAQYKRAVMNRAKAKLLLHFADSLRSDSAAGGEFEDPQKHTAYMAESDRAVSFILGITPIDCEMV